MDCLCYIVCAKCCSAIGKDTEVLFCDQCHLWQHKQCAEGVADTFYQEFYLATVLGEKPKPWVCQHCCQNHQTFQEKSQTPCQVSTTTSAKAAEKNTSCLLPPNPPCFGRDDTWSGNNSNSSCCDELYINYEADRTEWEGPGPYCASTTTTSDKRVMPMSTENTVIINCQPVFSDTSRHPTLYTLYRTTSGQMCVTDNLGNMFKPTQEEHDAVTMYQCATPDCGFKVRVCKTIQEFLCAGSLGAEQHNHTSIHTVEARPEEHNTTSEDNLSLSESSFLSDDERSSILPEITSTPFNTPSGRKCTLDRFVNSYCSDSTDDEDLSPAPLSVRIQRFTALHRPISRACLNVSFSSESDDDDACCISDICNRLDDLVDSADEMRESACIPPSPASTIPAVESSGSLDESILSLPPLSPAPTSQPDQSMPSVATSENQSTSAKSSPSSVLGTTCSTRLSESPNRVTPLESTTSPPTSPESPASTTIPQNNIITNQQEQDSVQQGGNFFYEIESCLPRQKKPGSLLLTADGFIFQTKVLDSSNSKTYWRCTEKGVNGSKCKANLEFNNLHAFSTDFGSDRTWLKIREDGTYTTNHNHDSDYMAVTLAKLRMMIRRRIFHYGALEETPNSLIPNIFQGIDYQGQPYLDSNSNPVLTAVDKDYLPYCPAQIQVLKRFVGNQKTAYKQETSNKNSRN